MHVKSPILSAKDDKDAKSYNLHSNGWIHSQHIVRDAKFGRFCLTLGGDACLWYESIPLLEMIGVICKNIFTDKSLNLDKDKNNFQREGSFLFYEATDMIDLYVLRLKHCSKMLRYNRSEVLELMKNTLPTEYYCFLFGIQNLRRAVESTMHAMTKS